MQMCVCVCVCMCVCVYEGDTQIRWKRDTQTGTIYTEKESPYNTTVGGREGGRDIAKQRAVAGGAKGRGLAHQAATRGWLAQR